MASKARAYTVEEKSRNVHTVKMEGGTGKWERWFLLSSDRHHDNAKTLHKLELKHLNQAKERNAGIIDCGDLHCAMQGKWDKRASTEGCRPEQKEGRYLDSLVECAADFYAPYADNWITMGYGNHETSIIKRHETDLVARTVERINTMTGARVHTGGYSGWVRFTIKRAGHYSSFRLKYHHGYGGGGPVTRGAIQTNRMAVYLPDADIVCSGHTHDAWQMPIARERINAHDKITHDEQMHIKLPTYKEEYADGNGGWHIERGGPPKPLGAYWLRFYYESENYHFEVLRAK